MCFLYLDGFCVLRLFGAFFLNFNSYYLKKNCFDRGIFDIILWMGFSGFSKIIISLILKNKLFWELLQILPIFKLYKKMGLNFHEQ